VLFAVETAAGSGTPTMTFKQDGEKLTDTTPDSSGNGPHRLGQGREVSFKFTVDAQGTMLDFVYTGTVESKDAMKGRSASSASVTALHGEAAMRRLLTRVVRGAGAGCGCDVRRCRSDIGSVRLSAYAPSVCRELRRDRAEARSAKAGSRTVIAQAPDPAALYKDNCASCHDQPTGRTPPKDALKERTAEAILTAMTSGSMSVQAINIAPADKRRLAEFLSGKTLARAAA